MGRLPIKNFFKKNIQLILFGRFSFTFDQLEFCATDLHIRKRLNLLAQGAQMAFRSVKRFGFPPILQIEPANVCNLHCLTCATGAELMKRPKALMPFEMYCNVIDQVKDYVCMVAFWSWGEPFINQDAFRMIRYAKDNGLLVHTSTNGHFFNTKERARRLIESGLDSLIVAADGLDQATYEKYRKGGRLDLVIESIENLVAERTATGAKNPIITFRFIVMKHNEHQLNQVKDFAENLGVDVVTFRSAVIKRGETNRGEDLLPADSSFQIHEPRDPLPEDPHTERFERLCHRPYANLTVFSDGTVVACEEDYNAVFPMGNVSEQSLRTIVSSTKFKQFISKFNRNPKQFYFCQTCELLDSRYKTHNVKTYILNQEVYNHASKA
jgi:radical SAM protein with 4Fe4S-binding SPASM domain